MPLKDEYYQEILAAAHNHWRKGKCPSIPPSAFPDRMEKDVARDAPQKRRIWEKATDECRHPTVVPAAATNCGDVVDDIHQDSHDNNFREDFLKLHRPDRLQKCILDPAEVQEALAVQAEHLMTEQELLEQETVNDVNDMYQRIDGAAFGDPGQYHIYSYRSDHQKLHQNQRFETASPSSDILSDFAPSVLTTTTVATKLASNSIRTQNKRHRHGASSLGRQQGNFSETPTRGGLRARNEDSPFVRAPNGSLLKEPTHYGTEESQDYDKRMRQREVINKYVGVFTSCVQPKGCIDDFGCSGTTGVDDRDAAMSVLRLRMKAQLGYYFTKRYCRLFPDAPMPKGIMSRDIRGDVPELISNDSDSSSSESGDSNLGFGAIPHSSPIVSGVTGSVFMDLALTGSLGLVPRNRTKSPNGRQSQAYNQKSPDHYVVLMNRRSGTPLAVCAMKASPGLPVSRIYATKQRVQKQRAAATTSQLGLDWTGNLPLYAWAEVVTESMHPNPEHFSVYMASGSDGKFASHPSYIATKEIEDGFPILKVIGRTDQENRYSGSALITLEASDTEDEDLRFSMDIANGIDPALLVCLTGIMDEVMEKSMRVQCKEKRAKQTWEVPQFS